MASNFVGDGARLHHTLTAAVSSGDVVVLAGKAGIAETDGAVGDNIAIAMVGVFNVPLKSGGGALPMGTIVSYNAADGVSGGAGQVGDINSFGYVAVDGVNGAANTVAVVITADSQYLAA